MTKIAERTGGKVLEAPTEAFRDHPFKSGEKIRIAEWLILASMILFFIDITLRRFGMFKGLTKKRLVREQVVKETSTAGESISELLKAKKKR